MSEDKSFFTDEELKQIKKNARRKSITVTRWVCAFVILIVLSLSWYGAEMMLYGYSQPSVVKALVAIGIAIGVSGKLKKEMIWNDNKKDFLEGFVKAIKEHGKESADC